MLSCLANFVEVDLIIGGDDVKENYVLYFMSPPWKMLLLERFYDDIYEEKSETFGIMMPCFVCFVSAPTPQVQKGAVW